MWRAPGRTDRSTARPLCVAVCSRHCSLCTLATPLLPRRTRGARALRTGTAVATREGTYAYATASVFASPDAALAREFACAFACAFAGTFAGMFAAATASEFAS